jgi:hypothetical protein
MYYVIHTNVFKENSWNVLMDWVTRNNIDHEILPFRPFVNEVELQTTRKDIWCWGSVSLAKLAGKYGWQPGSMMNENHDLEVYAPHYLDNMLNWDGETIFLGEELPTGYDYFFARPTKDSKAFTGQLFSKEAWYEWREREMEVAGKISGNIALTKNTKVLIAPLKTIQQEVRCWVVGGKVVSASSYKIGSRTVYQNYDDESFFVDFAQKMVDLYQPAEAFVIDVCLADDKLKVVEINCINSAGFYDVNMNKLMTAVENHFTT